MKYIIFACALLIGGAASATETISAFKINKVFVSNAENFHFRVYGMPAMSFCPDGSTWAYINEADSGAKGKISTLLSAYAAGKDVVLYVTPTDPASNGKAYCKITEFMVQG